MEMQAPRGVQYEFGSAILGADGSMGMEMQAPPTTVFSDAYSAGYRSVSQRSQEAPRGVQYEFGPAILSGDGSMGMEMQAPHGVHYEFGPGILGADGSMGMEMQAPPTTVVATTSLPRTPTPSYMPELVATTSLPRTPTPSYMPESVDYVAPSAMPVEWNKMEYYLTAPEVQSSMPMEYTLPAGVVDVGTFTETAGAPVEFSSAAEYLPDFQPWQAMEYKASFPSRNSRRS